MKYIRFNKSFLLKAIKIDIGKRGLQKTWQAPFPEIISCVHCGKDSRIGFVAHEGIDEKLDYNQYISSLHENKSGEGGAYWLHDCCAVAVYFCVDCYEATALYNQA